MQRPFPWTLLIILALAVAGAAWWGRGASQAETPVAWDVHVENARWIASDPAAFAADLIVEQTGTGPARNVQVYIRYPQDLFLVTDLNPSPDGWLPFQGGKPIPSWQPGAAERLHFGFRYNPQSRDLLDYLVHRADVQIRWRENGRTRSLEVRLPPFPIAAPADR